MRSDAPGRPTSLAALLLTAIATGAFAGLVAAAFIWVVQEGIEVLWTDLPDRVGVDPFGSWWALVVPVAGGALVGLGQRALGNYPRPLEEAIATWRAGGHIEPVVAPKTGINALVALVTGGPVGFEAALTGLLGGTATWIGARITAVGHLVRQSWGAERIDALPGPVQKLPYWLAAVAGLFAFHWWPFGSGDLGFRFADFHGDLGIGGGLTAAVFGALVVLPVAWMISAIRRAEHATLFARSPILIGMAGGLVFAVVALPQELVLFSGQQGIKALPDATSGALLYITVAKWLALLVALLAGWRGGPIFPTYTAVAAAAVLFDRLLVSHVLDVAPDVVIVAGLAAVGVVFLRGNVPMAAVLTLYPVDLSYAGVVVAGALGAAVAFTLVQHRGLLPADARTPDPAPTP